MTLERLWTFVVTAPPATLVVAASYAIAVGAVTAEVAWRARRDRGILRSARTGVVMAAGAIVVGFAYTAALRVLWDSLRWEAAAGLWRSQPVLGAVATFVAWDLAGWLYHLAGHRTRVGWAAHQPHHSGPGFDLSVGLRQSWFPFHGLVLHPLLALAGFDLAVVVVCSALSNGWQVLEHTSVEVRLPRWFGAHVMTPGAHRHHHGREGALVNLGPVLTWWDRLAGTWVPPEAPAPAAYGPAVPAPANPIAVELAGWRQLVRSAA